MRPLTPILCLAATTALLLKQPPTIRSWRVANPNARQDTIVFAITPGQALYQKFVVDDPNVPGEKRIDDIPSMWWVRDKEMDRYAAELIRAQEGSLELEQKYTNGLLKVGDVSKNGAVKHLGSGVFLEKDTPAVDADSELGNPVTITRSDLRDVAQRVVREVDAKRSVAVIGHPGTGKTRGGLTYAIQILLSRGEAVLRVGYKEKMVYAFLPNKNGTYEVWMGEAVDWFRSLITKERTAYTLIDPPERGAYVDSAICKIVKYVSNNVEKHYQNFNKDGQLIIADMPTEDEMVAMTETLWDDQRSPLQLTDGSLQTFSSLASKQEEVLYRCVLVGNVPRLAFSAENFRGALREIIKEAQCTAKKSPPDVLLDLYNDKLVTINDNTASSVPSRLYNLRPLSSTQRRIPLVDAKPLVKYLWRKAARQKNAGMGYRTAFIYEDFCALLLQGGTIDGVNFPPRTPVWASDAIETSALIVKSGTQSGSVIIASENYPVLDFATSLFDWYNAKSGNSKHHVNAGDFATLMLDLGLANKVGGRLVMNPHYQNARISLTMLRNRRSWIWEKKYHWDKETGSEHEDLKSGDLKMFFKTHVDVKILDTRNWVDRASDTWDKLIDKCLQKYDFKSLTAKWNALN